jgi:hypothetical protein
MLITLKTFRRGSRKQQLYELFDREGRDVAWERGKQMGLKEATLKSSFNAWERETARIEKHLAKHKARTRAGSE